MKQAKKRAKKRAKTSARRTRVGSDLEDAFKQLAAFMRGEIELEGYEVDKDTRKADPTKMIRHKELRRAR